MAYSERELLARLIECEAGGEGIDGMKAVATVIMNRVNAMEGEFSRVSNGGSIRNIILQPDQFTCLKEVVNGQYNRQNIYNMNPTEVHYEIADWAIGGGKHPAVGDALFFFNPYSEECVASFPYNGTGTFAARINAHCFYSPTEKYFLT